MLKSPTPFIKFVRANKTSLYPTGNNFNLSEWHSNFKNHGSEEPLDQRFFVAGLWVFHNMERWRATRKHFSLLPSETLSKDELIQAYVAKVNYSFCALTKEQIEQIDDYVNHGIIPDHKTGLTFGGPRRPMNDWLEATLDSVCGPLYELLECSNDIRDFVFRNASGIKLNKFDFVMHEMRAAQIHFSFKKFWQEFLFGDAVFEQESDTDHVWFAGLSHRSRTLAEYRRAQQSAEVEYNLMADLEKFPFAFEQIAQKQKFLSINKSNVLEVINWHELREDIRKFALADVAREHYFLEKHIEPLLNVPSLPLGNITIKFVLQVWTRLVVLARHCVSKKFEMPVPEDWQSLLGFCPIFYENEIVKYLAAALDVELQKVQAAMSVLTYVAKDPRSDLWTAPILKADKTLLLVWPALLMACWKRNTDHWLNLGGFDVKARGKYFEARLISLLQESKNKNPILGSTLSWTNRGLELEYDAAKGMQEIDATFAFGKLIVVAELRSRRRPLTPLDYHNDIFDKNGLLKKAEQAKLRAKYIRDHLQVFCKDFYPHLLNCLDSISVVPIVVIDGHYSVGEPINDIAILDIYALQHFIRDGRFKMGGADGKEKFSVYFYKDLDEAESIFPKYAMQPTVVQLIKAQSKKATTRSDQLGPDTRPISCTAWEVDDLDHCCLETLFTQLSFGNIVEHNV